MTTTEYDVIVIGGGPVGENAAQYAVQGTDLTAAIVEGELLGGECSYYACMPSKALLRPLDIAVAAKHLDGIESPDVVPSALLERRDAWVSHYDDQGQVEWAEGIGIDVIRGRGRITGERKVAVGGLELTARKAVVVATGSVPVIPEPFEGLEPWTSRDATGVVDVPGSLAIIGGGVVACESARWLAALGAKVTMLVRGPSLLPKLEPFAGDLVADSLRKSGVEVLFETTVSQAVRRDPAATGLGRVHGGPVTLDARDYDEVLVATGRRPATDGIGLPEQIPDWLHLVGDVSGAAPLTHWGKYQARLLGDRLAGRPTQVPDDVPVPQVVFTDPQAASVGATLAQAGDARAVDVQFGSVAGASLLRDDLVGRARLVVRNSDDVLIGATFVGTEVAELLHSATVAIVGGLSLSQLWHAVPSYPTASEVWLRLLEADRGARPHTP